MRFDWYQAKQTTYAPKTLNALFWSPPHHPMVIFTCCNLPLGLLCFGIKFKSLASVRSARKLSVSVKRAPSQTNFMAPGGDGYRQTSLRRVGWDVDCFLLDPGVTILQAPSCWLWIQSPWCWCWSQAAIRRISRETMRRLLLGVGEVLVRGGEAGEYERVDQRLRPLVQGPQQGREGGRWYGPEVQHQIKLGRVPCSWWARTNGG